MKFGEDFGELIHRRPTITIPDYDPKSFDLPGKTLLGDSQLKFLDA